MRRILALLSVFGLLVFSLSACGGQTATEPEVKEPVAEATPEAPAEPTVGVTDNGATGAFDVMAFTKAEKGGELIYGTVQEADDLYLYGSAMLAKTHVLNALYDGPVEGGNYDYEPVIFEKLPKLDDPGSGATLEEVDLKDGDKYVDPTTQEVMTATITTTEQLGKLQQLTVQFKMRPGIKWEDGTPVTADDSVFSSELSCDEASSQGSKFLCERTLSYKKIDDLTVEWKGMPGFTDQTYYTDFYTPLPRHQIGAGGKRYDETARDEIMKDEVFTRKPLSFGPFKLETWVPKDSFTLVRNENYWRASEGLPFLDKLIYKIVPDNNALVVALKSGDIDVAGGLDITQYDALEEAKGKGELVPDYVLGTSWEHIDFNFNPTNDDPAFGACTEFRKAVITGTDRQRMVDQILKGKSTVLNGILGEEHWAYPPAGTVPEYKYDVEAAKKLLEDLGLTDADGDGVRSASKDITCKITTDINGGTKDQVIKKDTPLELTLLTTQGNPMREQVTLLFQQNMKDIGMKVNLVYQDAKVYFGPGPEAPLKGRSYMLGLFGWVSGVSPSVALYYCTDIPSLENNWNGQNQTGWCDPEYDKVAKKSETTLKRSEALPLYAEAQKKIMENVVIMPLFPRLKIAAYSPDMVNLKQNATINSETWNAETWGFAEGSGRGSKEGVSTDSTTGGSTDAMTTTNPVTP